MRTAWIVCAAAAACPLAAMAEHPGRPANLPPLGSAHLYFVRDDSGAIHAAERGVPFSVNILVFGWSFDPNVPDSPFVSSGPAYTLTDSGLDGSLWWYGYQLTQFTFDRVNVEYLKQNPNAPIGPERLALFDFSKLKVTDSILKSQIISASDYSDVEISNSQIAGSLQMRSVGTMKLTGVTRFGRFFENTGLGVLAARGTTEIASSELDSILAIGTGTVTVSNSTIRGDVSTGRGELHDRFEPSVTLANTPVDKLTAGMGYIQMAGGRVRGVVQATGAAEDPLRPGKISLDGVPVGGSVLASTFGRIHISGGSIAGSVTVGDASGAAADISIYSADVAGKLQALGSGTLGVALFQSIGAVQASGNSRVELGSGGTIRGSVQATGTSQVKVTLVERIDGEAIANQGARLTLDLNSTNTVGAVWSFGDAKLAMSGGRTSGVVASGGDVELRGVEVMGEITVAGKSNLSFSFSKAAGSITNFGDGTGLVQIDSGTVGGDLVGLGRSVTAMRSGYVDGMPIFGDQATFLYSGGFFAMHDHSPPPPDQPEDRAPRPGADGAATPDLLSTSTGFIAQGDATIQFIGFGLQSTLVDADVLKNGIHYSVYQLTGALADHSRIDGGLVFVQNAVGTARFMLVEAPPPVPEPSAAAMLLLGLSCLGWMRCSHRATPACRVAAPA